MGESGSGAGKWPKNGLSMNNTVKNLVSYSLETPMVAIDETENPRRQGFLRQSSRRKLKTATMTIKMIIHQDKLTPHVRHLREG